jgi:predicted ArsR family transcriptional regulator
MRVSGLQRQARALGDPTRHEIYRYILDAPGPVGIAELTEHLGVHHNAVRQHLAKLVDAGLLVESTRPVGGRGRPRLQYAPDVGSAARWGAIGPYERLAVWLTEVIRSGATPVEVGRRAGTDDPLVDVTPGDPVASMARQMARHGFAPTVARDGDRAEITLNECPFASAALADQRVVCALHLGMAEGFADVIGGIEVEELIPTDPRQPSCRLRCRTAELAGAAS